MPQGKEIRWARLWRGLVVDPQGKHYHRLKNAVWLLLYLIIHADWTRGSVPRKYATIARDMGLSMWTIRYWMRHLRANGYIRTVRRGQSLMIYVLRWRPPGQPAAVLGGSPLPDRRAKIHPAENAGVGIDQSASGKSHRSHDDYENLPTRSYLRDGREAAADVARETGEGRARATTREDLLALDLAEGLHDVKHLARYARYAGRYPEPVLRRLLSEARAVPDRQMKRSKAALFEYLRKRIDA